MTTPLRDAWRVFQDCARFGTCDEIGSSGTPLAPSGTGSTKTGTAPPNPPTPPPPPPEDDMVIIPNMPPPPGSDPFGSGFTTTPTTQPINGGSTSGGKAPDTLCQLAGISAPCTYVELVLAGATHLFNGGGSGSEPAGGPSVPGTGLAQPTGDCPGVLQVKNPITGECVDLGALGPGGDPAFVPSTGSAVHGRYGVGVRPMERTRRQLRCPPGMVLGKDNVCYERLGRRQRKWDPGMKPLLTGGDRAAIRKAAAAARKLKRSRKMIRKASRELDKVC